MKPKLYLETSVARLLVSRPKGDVSALAKQEQARQWWKHCLADFDVYVSPDLLSDLARYCSSVRKQIWQQLQALPLLPSNAETAKLSKALVKENAVAKGNLEAADHIAAATVHGMEFLLTCDCQYIANALFRRKIEAVCSAHKFKCPTICLPAQLMGEHAAVDPIVAEIHAVRREISAEHGHDPRRLMAHYMTYEKYWTARANYISETQLFKKRSPNG